MVAANVLGVDACKTYLDERLTARRTHAGVFRWRGPLISSVRIAPLEAQGVERHAHDEKDRTCIVHLDLPPQKAANDPRVSDHLFEERVDGGCDELVLKGANFDI